MSTIKLNRAAKIATTGRYPRTWDAIIAAMPVEVVAGCTAKQIAAIADAMRDQYQSGAAEAIRTDPA